MTKWEARRRWLARGLTITLMAAVFAVFMRGLPAFADPTPASSETAAPEEPKAEEKPLTLEDLKATLDANKLALDTVWTLLAAFLVMWMQAGFAAVECGLTRPKNSVNIMMKNLLDFSFGGLAFYLVGFGFMFGKGAGALEDYIGASGFMMQESASDTFGSLSWTQVPLECKFFFQMVFCATAATIVSGAMAERTKFVSYMIYSIGISALIYPISGHWIWGGGWLAKAGFFDFAGSTVVHSCGGWMALVGAAMLGARYGKFTTDGKPKAIPGHNLPLVTLGVFILWLGWFGFNPGSTMAADPGLTSHIVVTTNTAACTGCIAALFFSKMIFGKWDATMTLNGCLAGLVAVTAPCPWISFEASAVLGAVAGVAVVVSCLFFENVLKIDDPVGAISVHGVCGALGTLSLGLLSMKDFTDAAGPKAGLLYGGGMDQLISQAMGVGAMFVWCMVTGVLMFGLIKGTIGLRVHRDEEIAGLDLGEHGNEAYHGFVTNS